jgi:uncharacterized protein YecE (DUF72 family)
MSKSREQTQPKTSIAHRAEKWTRFFASADLRFAPNDAPLIGESIGSIPKLASASGSEAPACSVPPPATRSFARAPLQRPATPDLRIGTSGWHYRSWHGPFYPADVRIRDFLAYYVTRFDTAEINNSFYRLPSEAAVAAWRDAVPDGFVFAWKVSRFITHMKRLKDIEDSIALVFGRMAGLGDRFGPVLFQLPPTFRADAETRDRLARCLDRVPPQHRTAFEFRHPSWYDGPVLDLLKDRNAALCLSDHADAPAPWVATADFVYVRAHGTNGRYAGSYDLETLQAWRDRIAGWREERRDVYVYFDNDIKSAAPGDASRLLTLTGQPDRPNGPSGPGRPGAPSRTGPDSPGSSRSRGSGGR